MNVALPSRPSPIQLPDDSQAVAQQLQTLAVLTRAQHQADAMVRGLGTFFGAIPIVFLAMKTMGLALDGPTSSLFVHRLARLPWGVVAIMVVCGTFIAVVAARYRRRTSPVLDHLRANPTDALLEVATLVEVRQGYRSLHLSFKTRAGVVLTQNVGATFEAETLAAIERAGITTRPW